MKRAFTKAHTAEAGVVLMEATIAMGLAVFLALVVMKCFLLGISSNQWSSMQTLADAYLSRETALSNRVPMADLTARPSAWPDASSDNPPQLVQTVALGMLPGGSVVKGQLTRFRVNETVSGDPDIGITVWRLHSLLTYKVGEQQYVKSRSTIRTQ